MQNCAIWKSQNSSTVVVGTNPPIHIDIDKDEPGMTLQREYREGDYRVWRDYKVNGKTVKSPVDIDGLPWVKYRLMEE